MQVMETRQLVDDCSDRAELEKIEHQNMASVQTLERQLSKAFPDYIKSKGRDGSKYVINKLIVKLGYLEKINSALTKKRLALPS